MALIFAKKNYERLKGLSVDQGVSTKQIEQAAVDLAAAQTDVSVSEKQLALLKASPTPEELRRVWAK